MLSGLILAGGRSSRMGRDKATLTLPDGRTLLQRQADILRATGVTNLLVSVRPGSETHLPGAILVPDSTPDAGPLAGIAAGLRAAPPGLVLVLAVDMAEMQSAHLRQLVELATTGRGVVPMLAGQCEPLAAIYPTELAGSAAEAVASGQRAVHKWVRREADRLLLWETPAEWAGVLHSWNTAADLPPPG
jgi:molybdopterin-guanine dinucleotide biosynthesis protein A